MDNNQYIENLCICSLTEKTDSKDSKGIHTWARVCVACLGTGGGSRTVGTTVLGGGACARARPLLGSTPASHGAGVVTSPASPVAINCSMTSFSFEMNFA